MTFKVVLVYKFGSKEVACNKGWANTSCTHQLWPAP